MQLPEVIETLRQLNKPVPRPARLPTETEVASAEQQLGARFSKDYRYFLLHGSDVVYGVMEPAQVTPEAGHRDLVKTATAAWGMGVPRQFLPFCGDNGDYYCLAPDGQVAFWSHNGWSSERWPDLAHWIQQVWITEYQEMEDERLSD